MSIMRRRSKCIIILSAIMCVCILQSSLWAEEQDTKDDSSFSVDDATGENLDDVQESENLFNIMVTAEKRADRSQDVPVSMSALSEKQLEDAGITSAKEMTMLVPNVHTMPNGFRSATTIFSRGIISSDQYNSTVGFYVDDVSYPMATAYDTEFFDIERIEILRGPQGTLYGRNSLGGVINIITKKPENEWEAKGDARYGTYQTKDFRGAVGGALIDNLLFVRVSGVFNKRDGFSENEYTDNSSLDYREGRSGRAQLRFMPLSNLEIIYSADLEQIRDGDNAFTPIDDLEYEVNWDYDGTFERDSNGHSLKIVYDHSWFSLSSISAYRDYSSYGDGENDYTVYDIVHYDYEDDDISWSEEVRLQSSPRFKKLKWLLGAYCFKENRESRTRYFYGDDVTMAYPIGDPYRKPGVSEIQNSDLDIRGYAFFGQSTYTFLKKLGLTAGLRYDNEKKELDWDSYYEYNGSLYGSKTERDFEKKDHVFLPKFALDYKWSPKFMTYASVSKGYKAGGFNYLTSSEEDLSYDPEYSWNYEAGIKSSWFDNRLGINFAGFIIQWDDLQMREERSATEWVVVNAGSAESKGVEVEVFVSLFKDVQLLGSYGYTMAKYEDYSKNGVDYDGNYIPRVPKNTWNVAIHYHPQAGFFGRVDFVGIGGRYWESNNEKKADQYMLINARLGYAWQHIEVYAWAKNITNKEYSYNAFNSNGQLMGMPGDRRVIGGGVTGTF